MGEAQIFYTTILLSITIWMIVLFWISSKVSKYKFNKLTYLFLNKNYGVKIIRGRLNTDSGLAQPIYKYKGKEYSEPSKILEVILSEKD